MKVGCWCTWEHRVSIICYGCNRMVSQGGKHKRKLSNSKRLGGERKKSMKKKLFLGGEISIIPTHRLRKRTRCTSKIYLDSSTTYSLSLLHHRRINKWIQQNNQEEEEEDEPEEFFSIISYIKNNNTRREQNFLLEEWTNSGAW